MTKVLTTLGMEIVIAGAVLLICYFGVSAMLWIFCHVGSAGKDDDKSQG